MSVTITAKEQALLAAFISQLGEVPKVDWDVIAGKVGHKYGRNARSAFNKVWDKLKAGPEGAADEGEGSDTKATNPVTPVKKPASARKRKAEADDGPKPPKTPRKSKKKEEEVEVVKYENDYQSDGYNESEAFDPDEDAMLAAQLEFSRAI